MSSANPNTNALAFLEGVHYGAYAVNLGQTIRFWNQGAERMTGHKAEDVVGRSC